MKQGDFLKAIERYQHRRMALLVDDSDPASLRAALSFPAQGCSAEDIALCLRWAKGHICVTVSEERAHLFALSPMRPADGSGNNGGTLAHALVSVEAREGVHSGISAADRATTVRALASESPSPRLLVQPGHVFPVLIQSGGVLVRNHLPEAASDFNSLAQLGDVSVFSEILGETANYPSQSYLSELARSHELPLVHINDIVQYRLETESLIHRVAEAEFPCSFAGRARTIAFRSDVHEGEHLAIVKGDIESGDTPVLTRVQSEHTIDDVFGSGAVGSSSKSIIHQSLALIGERGRGVFVYLRRQQTNQLEAELRGVRSQQAIMMRAYGVGAQILRNVGVSKIELISSSSRNLTGLAPFGIEICSQYSLSSKQESPFKDRPR